MSTIGTIFIAPFLPQIGLTNQSIAAAAARAGAIGVIDLESCHHSDPAIAAAKALHASCGGGSTGLRFCTGQLATIRKSLSELGTATQKNDRVAIITAGHARFDKTTLKNEIAMLHHAGLAAFVETVNSAEAVLAQAAGADAVIAKGHEGAGRVGDTTTFVLIQQLLRAVTIPVWAQGGIGLHTVAAVAAAGAAGVVLDSQAYLCRDAQLPPAWQLRLSKVDGTETTLLDHSYRVLESTNQDSIPLGQDACFAKGIAERCGTIAGLYDAVRDNARDNLLQAADSAILSDESPLAKAHGTRYPIVQGAMTRVSDTAEFATSVATGGALPFLALSLMRADEIDKLLAETAQSLGSRPWGVGLLGFVPARLRKEQLEMVHRYRPPFALIAGGRPDQAKALEDAGTHCYLHVPSPMLLQSFIEMGSRRFIFEGKECGGHVGPRSSFVLWESMIDLLLTVITSKEEGHSFHILFAGGIHDDVSAAMVAAMAAPLTALGVNVGVLVGTAYLFTQEAVASGAIVKRFQDAALDCTATTLLETGPGHSIRCIDSPYKETFDKQREQLQQENRSRDEIREELELMNLGRLRIASKGLKREASSADLTNVSSAEQWHDGMYMVGQVAALHSEVTTIESLHAKICAGGHRVLVDRVQKANVESPTNKATSEPIAIVGMSCMFPQANDLERYWQNIVNKVDSITEIPASFFDWKKYYDPNPQAPEKIVSKWGGFLSDIVFDPGRYGIPPRSLDSIDPMQVLTLEAARHALEDAGYSARKFPRKRTSVIIANAGHGPITALYSLRSMLGWKLDSLDDQTKQQLENSLPKWTEDSFAGYLGNVTAGRVANRFDLGGINFAVDAACASSLAALYVGISELRARSSDVVLLGAADTHNQPGDYLSFSKTHALSQDGKCKTFDSSADGIVISEGIAMLVLKRLSDAERDGDRIYAVIRGIGGSSDGRDFSLTAPRADGQVSALERAYANAGISPATIQLVEAHGTGTVAGDKAEVEALTKVFSRSGSAKQNCAIGSVKTNIGHTKATAGLASIIKVAKSLHHRVMPPTINVKELNPACKFSESPFYPNLDYRPWTKGTAGTPRRAAVSAFGFGGTNFHTVLEEYIAPATTHEYPAISAWPAELFVLRAANSAAMAKAVSKLQQDAEQVRIAHVHDSDATSNDSNRLFALAAKAQLKTGECASDEAILTVVATSIVDLEAKLRQAQDKLGQSEIDSFSLPDVQYASMPVRKPVCFLFPGQGSQKVDMLKELSLYFPEIRQTTEQADELLGDAFSAPLSNFIYPLPAINESERRRQQNRLTQTQIAQPAVGVCDLAMLRVLRNFGVNADMAAGHSYGEYLALHTAGAISESELLHLSTERGRSLATCGAERPGGMVAVSADETAVRSASETINDLYIANVNAPQQVIVSGSNEAIEAALASFNERGIAARQIAVSAPFHTPFMEPARRTFKAVLAKLKFKPPAIPVYSNVTALPYPDDTAKFAAQLADHITSPVRFCQQLQAMHEAGARVFVEVGPGAVLTGLVKSTLTAADVVALATDAPGKNGIHNFLNVLATLLTNGVPVDSGRLFWNRLHGGIAALTPADKPAGKLLFRVNSYRTERIGAPKENPTASVTPQKELPIRAAISHTPNSAFNQIRQLSGNGNIENIMLEFQQSMLQMTNRFLDTQQQVMMAYLQSQHGTVAPSTSIGIPTLAPAACLEPIQPVVAEEKDTKTTAPSKSAHLFDKLLEIVSDRTGYPVDMLDPSLDLEADLGIDSIKRIEILNTFRKLLPQNVQDQLEEQLETLAAIKTLHGIREWLLSMDQGVLNTESVSSSPIDKSCTDSQAISRGTIGTIQLPPVTAAATSIAGAIVILSDKTNTATALQKILQKSGHLAVIVKPDSVTADKTASTISAIRDQHGHIAGLITLRPSQEQLFLLTKELETEFKNPRPGIRCALISTSQLGGNFGITRISSRLEPETICQQASTLGFIKSLAREWPQTHTKLIDFDDTITVDQMAKSIVDELLVNDRITEVGYFDGRRLGLEIVAAPYDPVALSPSLGPDSVILITGGARGITAAAALALAQNYKANFIIVGRLPRPSECEAMSTAALEGPRELKAAIMAELKESGKPSMVRDIEIHYQKLMREREARKSLAAIQATGSTVKYYSVDVSDKTAFGNLIDSIYETYGNIDAVIHGAGVIEDALLTNKTWDSFQRVYTTKVQGALTLLKHLRLGTLKHLLFFSSIVGRTGNAGQSDYCAANEALNKLAQYAKDHSSGRVSSLLWGPWDAGMAPKELKEAFASYGWSMIPPEQGVAAFISELSCDKNQPIEVMLVGGTASQSLESPAIHPAGVLLNRAKIHAVDPIELRLTINSNEHVYLEDHKIGGVPVMPMAGAVELMIEAAQSALPNLTTVSIHNLDIPAGIMFDTQEKNLSIKVIPSSNTATVQIASGKDFSKLHYRCQVHCQNDAATTVLARLDQLEIQDARTTLPGPKDIYDNWLFHGPLFQGMLAITKLGTNGICGRVTGKDPRMCVTTAATNSWTVDPTLLDSAMQLAGVWARHYFDITVLPTGFKALHIFQPAAAGEFDVRILSADPSPVELYCDLGIYDATGAPVLVMEGLTGVGSKSFNRFAGQPSTKDLVR